MRLVPIFAPDDSPPALVFLFPSLRNPDSRIKNTPLTTPSICHSLSLSLPHIYTYDLIFKILWKEHFHHTHYIRDGFPSHHWLPPEQQSWRSEISPKLQDCRLPGASATLSGLLYSKDRCRELSSPASGQLLGQSRQSCSLGWVCLPYQPGS